MFSDRISMLENVYDNMTNNIYRKDYNIYNLFINITLNIFNISIYKIFIWYIILNNINNKNKYVYNIFILYWYM